MNIWADLIYTLRIIRKRIGFSTLCIVVVALGYAISIPLYSMVKNFAYSPLPFPNGDKFVQFDQIDTLSNSRLNTPSFDIFQLNAVSESASSFQHLGGYRILGVAFNDGDVTQQFSAAELTAETLEITAVTPIIGRSLQTEDEKVDAEPVVLLGYGAWQSYYGGQTEIIGRSARVNGVPHTIIGVMPADFKYPLASDLWLPLQISATAQPGAGPLISFIGVLEKNVDRQQASAELSTIFQRLGNDFPDHYSDRAAEAIPFTHASFTGAFIVFNSVAGLASSIFLLVCLNITNLLTVRANERVNELAIRTAMGARRTSLVFHVLFESFLVCTFGAALGLVGAKLVLGFVDSFIFNLIPSGGAVPFWFDFSYSSDMGLLASLMLVFLWLISSSFAAWRVTNKDIAVTLSGDSKGVPAQASGKLTNILVSLQIVVSFFLLVVSGVLVLQIQVGMSSGNSPVDAPETYYTASIDLSADSYNSAEDRVRFREEFRERLKVNSDIEAVTYSSSLPGSGVRGFDVTLESDIAADLSVSSLNEISWVDSNYFQTVGGFVLLAGRYFDEGDKNVTDNVVIVDDVFLQQMQLTESPLGKRVRISKAGEQVYETARVVGVLSRFNDGREIPEGSTPLIYRPLSQNSPARFQFIIKASSNTTASFAEFEEQVRISATAVDRDLSFSYLETLASIVEKNYALGRMFSSMITGAAFGAMILSLIAVYGLISRSVSARRREIGIRRAVGSTDFSITRIFLKQGFIHLSFGVLFGGGIAILASNALIGADTSQTLSSLLPAIFLLVTFTVGSLVAYASYVPVRKIISLEPGDALHYE